MVKVTTRTRGQVEGEGESMCTGSTAGGPGEKGTKNLVTCSQKCDKLNLQIQGIR